MGGWGGVLWYGAHVRRRTLSELECFVLGLIWQIGPCSAYDVRVHMQGSPSTQWSASAGAIYPLVQKLERLKLLTSRGERTGKRARRVYRITAGGERALRDWVGPPLAKEAVTVAHDPLRSRARFLEILPPDQRAAWVDAALTALDVVEERVRAWQIEHGSRSPISAMIGRSGEMDVAMRRAWLGEVRREATARPAKN